MGKYVVRLRWLVVCVLALVPLVPSPVSAQTQTQEGGYTCFRFEYENGALFGGATLSHGGSGVSVTAGGATVQGVDVQALVPWSGNYSIFQLYETGGSANVQRGQLSNSWAFPGHPALAWEAVVPSLTVAFTANTYKVIRLSAGATPAVADTSFHDAFKVCIIPPAGVSTTATPTTIAASGTFPVEASEALAVTAAGGIGANAALTVLCFFVGLLTGIQAVRLAQ